MEERERRGKVREVRYRIFRQSYTDQSVGNKFQRDQWGSRNRLLEHLVLRLLSPS